MQGFNDLFDVNHPIFCWLYRASFCWGAIKDAFPRILAQIEAIRESQPADLETQAPSTCPTSSVEEESLPDRSLLFRLLFLIAANDLASMIQQPVEKIGNLFAGVLDTGTVRKPTRKCWFFQGSSVRDPSDHGYVDEEADSDRTFGRGQALFLVRTVSSQESKELQAIGYRFAAPAHILQAFADNMEITKGEARKFLGQMQRYSVGERALAPGVHLACFLVRPEFHRGLGILVHQQAKNVLPTTQLPLSKLEPWQADFLLRMHNFTLEECCEQLQADYHSSIDERERNFVLQLLKGLADLRSHVNHPMLAKALLCANPLEVPSGIPGESSPLNLAVIIAFRIMLDIHPNSWFSIDFFFHSWRFFACQQRVYKGYPHHGAFVHHMRREIVSLRRDDVPEARQSAFERAQRSLNRFSRTAFDRVRLDASRGSTIPSSSTFALKRVRTSTTDGKRSANRDHNVKSTTSNETAGPSMDILEMLRSRPSFEAPVNNDVAPLDTKTYADVLMRLVAKDRGGPERAMNRIDPSF